MKKYILNPYSMFIIGGVLGISSKLFDIYNRPQFSLFKYFQFSLGDLFSELSIWILIGVTISIFSTTKKKAMIKYYPFV